MKNISLSDGEWKLMNSLWENAPCSLTQLVNSLIDETGWTKSTVFVMLKRLMAKGAVTLDREPKIQLYSPLVTKEECAVQETRSFLSMVYNGSIGMMVSSLADHKALSEDEIDELRRILDEAEQQISDNEEK